VRVRLLVRDEAALDEFAAELGTPVPPDRVITVDDPAWSALEDHVVGGILRDGAAWRRLDTAANDDDQTA
jgi:hypothetical protein